MKKLGEELHSSSIMMVASRFKYEPEQIGIGNFLRIRPADTRCGIVPKKEGAVGGLMLIGTRRVEEHHGYVVF